MVSVTLKSWDLSCSSCESQSPATLHLDTPAQNAYWQTLRVTSLNVSEFGPERWVIFRYWMGSLHFGRRYKCIEVRLPALAVALSFSCVNTACCGNRSRPVSRQSRVALCRCRRATLHSRTNPRISRRPPPLMRRQRSAVHLFTGAGKAASYALLISQHLSCRRPTVHKSSRRRSRSAKRHKQDQYSGINVWNIVQETFFPPPLFPLDNFPAVFFFCRCSCTRGGGVTRLPVPLHDTF